MITPEEAEMLRRTPNGKLNAGQHKERALAARLERAGYVSVRKMMNHSIIYARTDLGYDALMQYEKHEMEKVAQASLIARLSRSPAKIWSVLNSNLVVGIVSAIIGYILGKLT